MLSIRARLLLVACLGSALLIATPVFAQWPTVMMFYGGPLKSPIVVTGADSVVVGTAFRPPASSAPTAVTVGDRPFISVACFWGPPQNPAMNGTAVADLRPEMASEYARFYPATKDQPAAVFLTGLGGNAGAKIGPNDIANITMKGRDIYGNLIATGRANAPAATTKVVRIGGMPENAAAFLAAAEPPPWTALERLRALGVPVRP